eukprot:CAMPEP_0116104912 /NCGR_PEP_ID=MMETSP0327-20121206/14724_1 /TAXON_ID=44447 /ORGANISM="Pseudo-nitzschia delicatissima, Strain B596" /LENGTH=386 /DNA_ID=CAMNT_0003597227 /DNA_START=117 /DNA_END=1280 /DNA_ORIENTATION=-
MQVSPRSAKRSSSRLELIAYLFVGIFLYVMFDFFQGRDLTEYTISPAEESAIKETPVTELPEVKAAVEAAVAKALKEFQKASPPSQPQPQQQSQSSSSAVEKKEFKIFAQKTGTDKVAGHKALPKCIKNPKECLHPAHENERCRVWGHFYDTIYDRWLGPYATSQEPMQLLEIGYYQGNGFEAYTKYLADNKNAELHTMEISCIEEGPRDEGKWPWGNFAIKHKWYKDLLSKERLHCGDASQYEFLNKIWTTKMKRPDAPPLKVVIDDAAHLHQHMAMSLFYWFPRIEPGGIMVVEDVQPAHEAKKFRTHIVPQVMKDLHWCGGSGHKIMDDSLCFPTIQPLLQGVHCEMHICVFVRNDEPARELSEPDSHTPPHAFDEVPKCLFE